MHVDDNGGGGGERVGRAGVLGYDEKNEARLAVGLQLLLDVEEAGVGEDAEKGGGDRVGRRRRRQLEGDPTVHALVRVGGQDLIRAEWKENGGDGVGRKEPGKGKKGVGGRRKYRVEEGGRFNNVVIRAGTNARSEQRTNSQSKLTFKN